MNASIRLAAIILITPAIISISSCEKKFTRDSEKGNLEISFSLPDVKSPAKSIELSDNNIITSYHLLISIEDMKGSFVFSDSLIPLYAFGNEFLSEKVELNTGEYKLTKFMVINPSGEVVYASPVEDSPLAYLVSDPLPIPFNIITGQMTKVSPEVLFVGEQTPDDFGYASFGMQIIIPMNLWIICVIDNPLSMGPAIQFTTANLTVYAETSWHYTFKLEAATNHLIIRGGYPVYHFLLEKEGYLPQKMEFTAEQLMKTTKENPLILKIPWNSTIIWSDDFETYNPDTFPDKWFPDGNGADLSKNYVDNSTFYNGNKSLRLFGQTGGCWAAIAYHPLNVSLPYTIELAVRNGNETLSGCNPDRVLIGLNKSTTWTSPSQRYFIKFDGDGKIYGGGDKVLGSYKNDTWYLVRLKYEIISESEVKLSYWINNISLGSESLTAINEENLLNYLEIQVLEGSGWFDAIKVIK